MPAMRIRVRVTGWALGERGEAGEEQRGLLHGADVVCDATSRLEDRRAAVATSLREAAAYVEGGHFDIELGRATDAPPDATMGVITEPRGQA